MKRSILRGRCLLAVCVLALVWPTLVQAAPSTTVTPKGGAAPTAVPGGGGGEDVPPPNTFYEQGVLVRSGELIEALGPDLMGDAINEFVGGVVFTHTDVALPGNNRLAVSIGRRRAFGSPQANGGGLFGDWDLEIPRLHTLATQAEPNWYGGGSKTNFNRCSQINYPPLTSISVGSGWTMTYGYPSYWDGYNLYVPGSGDQAMLVRNPAYTSYPTDGTISTYPIVTKNHWQFSCLSALDNGPGEGFLARSPDGTSYRFDHIAVRAWTGAKVSWMNGSAQGSGTIPRTQVWILPTRVTDRFGNWVQYNYGSTDGWRVTSIVSSDGRTITFTYSGFGNRVQSITDGTRTWTYSYNGTTGSLQTVTRPDGSQWQFALDTVPSAPLWYANPSCDGDVGGTVDSTAKTGTITHPSGAVGSFTLKSTYHGRSGVTGPAQPCGMAANRIPLYYVSRSLASKSLSGPGMPAMTWNYAYSAAVGSYAPCNGCVNTKTVTITDPRGDVTVNTYGTQFAVDEGFILNSSEGVSGSTALRTTTFGYAPTNAGPYPASFGGLLPPGAGLAASHRPLNQRTITQQGVSFSGAVTDFDIYVRPVAMTRSSSLGYSRSESTTYYDHTNLWVLGQVASRTIAGITASSTAFDTANALPTATYKFGKFQASYAYNADGTMHITTDGRNNSAVFTNYMRGLPQNINFTDGTAISAQVNNIGTIDTATNEVGTFWRYTYDAMGRIASKTPPAGDAVGYNPTTFSFVQVPGAEVGLEANHWRQTITTGNAVTINYFDARWRKRLTTTYDASDRANTERAQRFDYDPYNRATFASYPARSIGSITAAAPGTVTSFDALGRQTQAVADSELGALTTTNQYLSGFQKRVIDPRGNVTTTSFQVFDEPSESATARIDAPEGLTLVIGRDIFGKPLSVTRSGTYAGTPISVTRTYVYDLNQLLCKTIEPETGATVQLLDAANNVAWRAPGVNLTNPSSCDWASVSAASQIAFAYDARNRLTGTGFGDGSPSIGRSYTPDGLPLAVVSNGSTWTYGYNNRRLLTSETLAYGQTYTIGRTYDSNGNLSQLTYPDGALVGFSPNALGEAAQASGYASGVTYHPNGSVAGYVLANGIVHTLSQNVRGLPFINGDTGIIQEQYGYDANANIAAIVDQQAGVNSRSMSYDGLDRLTSASAPGVWGSAAYSYDVLDNVRTTAVGSRNSTHNYGSNNLLSTVNTNGVYSAYAYDARGNVTGRGSQGFYFDLGNRMALANGVASYAYDGWGRRVYVSGSNGVARTQVYSNTGGQLLYGFRQQGMTTATTRYVYLGGKLIAETDSVLGNSFSHTDALGSPVGHSNAAGQLTSLTRYEPYGATAAGTNPGSNGFTGIGFTGHVNDAETGLVYMQQRYYDPIAARFLSIDPIVTDANTGKGFNLYEYAHSNPFRYTDPDGMYANCGQFVYGCTTIWSSGSSTSGSTVRSDSDSYPIVVAGKPGGLIPDDNGGGGRSLPILERGLDGGPVRYTPQQVLENLRAAREAAAATKGAATAQGAAGGDRAGKPFTKAGKNEVKSENAAGNGGETTCKNCGQRTVPAQQSKSGVTPPGNETHVDHIIPKSKGGDGSPNNGQVLCRDCNLKKRDN